MATTFNPQTGMIRSDDFAGTPKRPGAGLTRRQKQVLQLMAEGLSSRGIAERLGLSFYTVTTHLKTAYKKLGVHNRAGAVNQVLTKGVLHGPVPNAIPLGGSPRVFGDAAVGLGRAEAGRRVF